MGLSKRQVLDDDDYRRYEKEIRICKLQAEIAELKKIIEEHTNKSEDGREEEIPGLEP